MSLSDSPSLANITGTQLDSACKHIQQCRVSYDHMLPFVENADELEKDKMKFCAHKDEFIVGVGRPWKKSRTRSMVPTAYPRILSNLGNICKDDEKYKLPRMMIKFLFHTATDIIQRNQIIQEMDAEAGFSWSGGSLTNPKDHYFYKGQDDFNQPQYHKLGKYLAQMYDYYPVGVCNTIGYAHPRTGDTVSSVMIGGLRTVMNGDWEVQAGDEVQWYWTFEKDCFDEFGKRKKFMHREIDSLGNATHYDFSGMAPDKEAKHMLSPPAAAKQQINNHIANNSAQRQMFNDRQYGMKPQSTTPSDKAKSVARIKTYENDPECPRMYDKMRVCGRAIATARPNEALDIQISRQSM
jgi:hypothetical protein